LAIGPPPGAEVVTCRGPAVSLHFSIMGTVHACCENGIYSLGDVRADTLDEIWHGAPRREMAAALARGEYPEGCDLCAVEHRLGNRASTPAPPFDWLPEGDWPSQLEFTLSNRCNLACVQCTGLNSSTIRKVREKLPALPMPYGEAFFNQLGPYLDHAEKVTFLGGEPFLAPEAKRVWDLLRDRGLSPEVQVTTNATVWSDAIEQYVHDLRMSFSISMDGATRETYEAIRVGASWDSFCQTRDRLVAAAHSYGGRVQLNWCLMPANVHEVGLLLELADELGAVANIIPVHQPETHSIFALPEPEVGAIVARLEEEGVRRRPRLDRNRPQWDDLLRMLHGQGQRLAVRAEAAQRAERAAAGVLAEMAAWADGRPPVEVQVVDDRIDRVATPPWATVLDTARWPGARLDDLFEIVGAVLGPIERVATDQTGDDEGLVIHARNRATGPAGPVEFWAVWIPLLARLHVTAKGPLPACSSRSGVPPRPED